MGPRLLTVLCGALCLLISLFVSAASAQAFGAPAQSAVDLGFDRSTVGCGSSGSDACSTGASVYVGWMTAPRRIKLGYDGLVLPGSCVSSYFSYPLDGLQIGASVPIRLSCRQSVRLYGAGLIPHNWQAGQELTWTDNPAGLREWRHSKSQLFRLGAEALYQASCGMALVGGFRWESLLTTFSDPNPAYRFTIAGMDAQTTVTMYEPYLGMRLEWNAGPGGLTFQVVGFPFLFASIQHLNVCNNAGIPFAHTGSQSATKGYFFEASAEYRFGAYEGTEIAAFADWNVYRGQCPMTINRHEGGATPGTTSGIVGWSHDINSLVVGGKLSVAWNLPF